MPIITKITVQKKQKDRYNIYTDDGSGEKYAFSVDEAVLVKYQLKKGMEIDGFLESEVSYQDDIRKAYNQAVQYLAHRMRTESEVRQHLLKKEVIESIVNEVIHKLHHHHFLNDQEFAHAYVRTQKNTTDKGPVLIEQELKEKGVKQHLIDQAIQEYPFSTQLQKAILLGDKYLQKNKKDSAVIAKQKLEQMLVRKGYTYEIIQETLQSLEFDKDESEEYELLKKQGDKFVHKYRNFTGYEFSQKLKQALYRKGFPIELIEKYLTELNSEE